MNIKNVTYKQFQRHKSLLAIVLIYVLFLTSCSKKFYQYNNIYYKSKEDALAAQDKDFALILNKIEPTKNPCRGSLIAIIPSYSYIKNNYIILRGIVSSKQSDMESIIQYPVSAARNHSLHLIACIKQREIFSTVVTKESDNPEKVLFNEDYAILFFSKDGMSQWFMRKKQQPEELIPIQEPSTALPILQRRLLWLDDIEKVARGQ